MALVMSCSSSAQVVGPVETYKGVSTYSHQVEKGQTLYSLCKFYEVDINDVLALNPDADKNLKEGQTLYIPVDKSKIKSKPSAQGGKEIIRHEVKRKETLYSISKEYGVDINKIIALNPGCDQGLKKGQELLIPIGSSTSTPSNNIANLHQHTVVAGETLYSISRQYHVTVEAIETANPGLTDQLKEGQIISIPTKALPNDHSVSPPVRVDSVPPSRPVQIVGAEKKENYKIGILLPFYASEEDSSLTDKERTFRDASIHLYRGIQLGADSLAALGFYGDVFVKDIVNNKNQTTKTLSDKNIKDCDLLVGPVFKEAIQETGTLIETTGAHMVIPFPLSNKVLLSSANMSKAVPSDATQWEFMGRYVAQNHKTDQVILVSSGILDDTRSVQVFSQSYFTTRGDSVTTLKMLKTEVVGLTPLLSKTRKNILVVPTADKKTINAVFAAIKDYNCIVYGLSEWENLSNIKAEMRNTFNVRYPKSIYLDYKDETMQDWILAYRKKFKSEPTDFAVLGYNLMLYYGQALQQFGKDFPNHFQEVKAEKLLGTGFNYFKTGNESGFENRYCIVLESVDFEMKILK